jgi:hypothetical protein
LAISVISIEIVRVWHHGPKIFEIQLYYISLYPVSNNFPISIVLFFPINKIVTNNGG